MKFCNCTLPYIDPRSCENCPNNTDDFHLPHIKKYDMEDYQIVDANKTIESARRWARAWRRKAFDWFYYSKGLSISRNEYKRSNERLLKILDQLRAERDQLHAELDSLKSRRCDGCRWHKNDEHDGACFLPQVMAWYGLCVPAPDNHYCKAWQPKEVKP